VDSNYKNNIEGNTVHSNITDTSDLPPSRAKDDRSHTVSTHSVDDKPRLSIESHRHDRKYEKSVQQNSSTQSAKSNDILYQERQYSQVDSNYKNNIEGNTVHSNITDTSDLPPSRAKDDRSHTVSTHSVDDKPINGSLDSQTDEDESDHWVNPISSPFGGAKFRNLSFLSQSSHSNCPWESKSNEIEIAASNDKVSLPTLDSAEWVDNKFQRCPFFDSKQLCRWGHSCNRAHVRPRIGKLMHDEAQLTQILNSKVTRIRISFQNFYTKSLPNENGKLWFTAAYVDPETNVIYKSENKEGVESDEGVFWYKNEHMAKTAAKHTYLISKYLESKNDDIPIVNKKRKPKEEEQLCWKRPKTSRGDNKDLFLALVKEQNLQTVFMKIHPKVAMKKTCWNIHSIASGFSTATFRSPAPQDKEELFQPTNFGGRLEEGIWYYPNPQHAKAAVFYDYIMYCKDKGMISENLISTNTGKIII